ncbi:MAG: flagellar motor protein MotA [Proteobacteria bacterium]|nr:flagellar motor protein MotA [Pseudomonadota bacterium]
MSNPLLYLVRMLLFLVAVAGLAYVLHEDLLRVFLHTPILDGVIVAVLVLGIFFVFRQVILLSPEVTWIRRYQHRETGAAPPSDDSINLLAPLAAMLGERQDFRLSPTATRALLDGIATRLDERRELARYLIGLLIFLGLLGTFWGLLQTIGSVADAIAGLHVAAGDPLQMFSMLQASIEGPLKGMATAFGASLFGLSGSLVLGFLELQASQAQGRFHTELEEWLARATSLSAPSPAGEARPSVPAYIEALLERNAENTDGLLRALKRVEESRQSMISTYGTLVDRLGSLAETVRTQQALLARFTELSIDLRGSVAKLSERAAAAEELFPRAIEESERRQTRALAELQAAVNRLIEQPVAERDAAQTKRLEERLERQADEVRGALARLSERLPDADREAVATHQRNIETHLARLVEEGARDRAALADELRGELRLLARTVALAAPPAAQAPGQPLVATPADRAAGED